MNINEIVSIMWTINITQIVVLFWQLSNISYELRTIAKELKEQKND